jgi:hypothetical protein
MRRMKLSMQGSPSKNPRPKNPNLQRRPKHFVEILPPHDQLRCAELIGRRQNDKF